MVLASGLSAASLPFLTLAPGDHVVLQDVVYWGVRKWVTGFAARHGIVVDNFSTAEPTSLAAALRRGKPNWCGSKPRPTRPGKWSTSPPSPTPPMPLAPN